MTLMRSTQNLEGEEEAKSRGPNLRDETLERQLSQNQYDKLKTSLTLLKIEPSTP